MSDVQIFTNMIEGARIHRASLWARGIGLVLFDYPDNPDYFYLYNKHSLNVITVGNISHIEEYLERLSKLRAFL